LARLVLSDVKTLKSNRITSIAKQIIKAQVLSIARGIEKIAYDRGLDFAPVILIGPGRIYLKQLKKLLSNRFERTVGGHGMELIDPSSCAAALWEREKIDG
jgi:uncharacterized hydantoinase/oxoprolinase family protein